MNIAPKKFVESDFVTRMRLKHSTTSEDGTVNLNPKFKVACSVVGVALGAAATAAMYVVATRTILDKDNDSEETTED